MTAVMAVPSFYLWLADIASRSPLAPKLICSGTEKTGYALVAMNLPLASPSLLPPLYKRMQRSLKSKQMSARSGSGACCHRRWPGVSMSPTSISLASSTAGYSPLTAPNRIAKTITPRVRDNLTPA
jgi:hypothetical protein